MAAAPAAQTQSLPALPEALRDARQFMNLLTRQSARTGSVVARTYGNGSWQQFSGRDFSAHLGRSARNWFHAFPLAERKEGKQGTVVFLARNTYGTFVGALGAALAGLDVMFAPVQMAATDLRWCLEYFGAVALATDREEIATRLGEFGLPAFHLSSTMWTAQDRFAEPLAYRVYREALAAVPVEAATETASGATPTSGAAPASDAAADPEAELWRARGLRIGRFGFISFGNDGFQKPERLTPDALVVTAQNLLLHLSVPGSIYWKSLELLEPSNPFAHLSRLCCLLRNGVIGFPNTMTDWETNLRILRPSFLFAGPQELERIAAFSEEVAGRGVHRPRVRLGKLIEASRDLLNSSRALKLPEPLFDGAKKALRVASRASMGRRFVRESVEDLRFVVHGLAPAPQHAVEALDRLGVPVIETYGVTAAAGVLSANTFQAPHFNLLGTPLAHVSFRLGADSQLEYRLSAAAFPGAGAWVETGDVAQMTPFGFAITGRKRHLFLTGDGAVVSPVRLEQALKRDGLIADACVLGENLPYLAALVVLAPEAAADYRIEPAKVRAAVQELLSSVNASLPRNATIKKFAILERPFQEGEGEKLPGGGVNRMRIAQTREADINGLYGVLSAPPSRRPEP